jgi:hypothetical protein
MVDDGGAAEIALLDQRGVIESVNQAWTDFCLDNGGDLARTGVGVSYLDACARVPDDDAAGQVRAAIGCALAGQLVPPVVVQVPCDSPAEPRWFDVLVSSRFDPADGHCIGASVTLTRSRASRKPATGGASAGEQTQPAFPDLPRLEMERLVSEVIERCNELFTRHEQVRDEAERWRQWSTATLEACRSVLADDCARPFDAVTRSVVDAMVGTVAFVSTRSADITTIDATCWSPDEPAPAAFDATSCEPVLRGADPMLAMDGAMAVAALLVDERGTTALAVSRPAAHNPFDSTDLAALAVFVFHVATALRLARARAAPAG